MVASSQNKVYFNVCTSSPYTAIDPNWLTEQTSSHYSFHSFWKGTRVSPSWRLDNLLRRTTCNFPSIPPFTLDISSNRFLFEIFFFPWNKNFFLSFRVIFEVKIEDSSSKPRIHRHLVQITLDHIRCQNVRIRIRFTLCIILRKDYFIIRRFFSCFS